mmetsp:Transcript_10777/g.17656  ORF Transcript_10777/g.17656 Transcript_10777/m.17656 type:complete len:410 (+) Transcript_10777:72-1301(+)
MEPIEDPSITDLSDEVDIVEQDDDRVDEEDGLVETRDPDRVHAQTEFSYKDLVTPILVPSFIYTVERELVLPILPLFASKFTNNNMLVGLIQSAYGFGGVISNFPAGSITSIYGAKVVFALAIVFECSAAIVGLVANGVWLLVLSRFCSGASMTFFQLSRQVYSMEVVPGSFRGRVFSGFGAIRRVSALVAPILGGVLIEYYSTSTVFIIQVVMCTVCFVWGGIFMKSSPGKNISTEVRELESPFDEAKRFYKASKENFYNLTRLATYAFLLVMIRDARIFVVPVVASHIGFSAAKVGLCVGLGFGLDTLTVPLGGYILDRFGRKTNGCLTPMLMGFGFLCLGLVANTSLGPTPTNYTLVCISAALLGIGNGLSSGLVYTIGSDFAGTDRHSKAICLAAFQPSQISADW